MLRFQKIKVSQKEVRFDKRPDFRLSRESLKVLLDLLGQDRRHGWGATIETLVFLFWLASGASCRVVSRVFGMPRSTVHRIVHRVTEEVVAIRHQILNLDLDLDLDLDLNLDLDLSPAVFPQRVQQQRPDSPSCLSLKSDSSKDEDMNFKGRPPSADQNVSLCGQT
ncbi:hypothetical protein F7725_001379 [Dissostichus mawsoni]|uniref:Transposase Helix-turn-helix domain-containing protein n=1 Tax=Dissostichus mawsoni TaxID=36200 RepID=A0A7J5ZH36_DISMA|nr:hypothetical protein F7725_001379 [Dissostichus mawsoni]